MIKKFEQFDNHFELDPYGEEDWDGDNEFKVGDKIICWYDDWTDHKLKKGCEYTVKGIKDYLISLDEFPFNVFSIDRFVKKENENINHSDLDPYGEEDWNEDNFEKGDLLIAKKSQFKNQIKNNGIERIERIVQGERYRIKNVITNPHGRKYYTITISGILIPTAVFCIEQMKEYFEKI